MTPTGAQLSELLQSLPPTEVDLVLPRLLLAMTAAGTPLDGATAEYLTRFFASLGLGRTATADDVRTRVEAWAATHPVSAQTTRRVARLFGDAATPVLASAGSLFANDRPAPKVSASDPGSLLNLRRQATARRSGAR